LALQSGGRISSFRPLSIVRAALAQLVEHRIRNVSDAGQTAHIIHINQYFLEIAVV
jgi:hypothetical protein